MGIVTCWYISKTHNLKTWSPKDPNWAHSKNKYIAWGVIVAALINSFVIHFLGSFAVGFVFETVGTCFLLISGFIMFHSCQSENKSKTNQE